jgi:nucleoporin POM152
MNGTPRLRSSYPSTPLSSKRSSEPRESSPQDVPKTRTSLPNLPQATPDSTLSNAPIIPVDIVDSPTQRLYTLGLYGALLVWCLYDWWRLVEEDTRSIGLFIKWACIFAMFMYGVPQLRIPWLEWSTPTSNLAFIIHAVFAGMLMFRIPVCSVSCSKDPR